MGASVTNLGTLFQRISDSQFTWIHDFKEILTESVGPVLFSAEYLICRHVQKDGLTNELIWGGLGNLRFLQVNPALWILAVTDLFLHTGRMDNIGF